MPTSDDRFSNTDDGPVPSYGDGGTGSEWTPGGEFVETPAEPASAPVDAAPPEPRSSGRSGRVRKHIAMPQTFLPGTPAALRGKGAAFMFLGGLR